MTTLQFENHIIGYENNLRKFAYSLTSNSDDAFDLVQETYLKALSYKERLSNYSNLKSWMFSTMNRMRPLLRRLKRYWMLMRR